MRHLLIINPNTSGAVSDLLQGHAQGAAGPDVRVRTVTARFGAPYIACEASYAVAGHASLDAWAAALTDGQAAPDAVLIGCFGDPGLLALRDSSAVAVTGLAEAAFVEAAAYGRFAIVTGGARCSGIPTNVTILPAERVNDFATPCFMNLRRRVVLFRSMYFARAVG